MKYRDTTFCIAREAWRFAVPVAGVAVCLLLITRSWIPFGLLMILTIYILAFFRNPHRNTPKDDGLIVCPADGVVTAAGIVSHPDFPNGQALRVAVFMSLLNVHINWTPCAGTVERVAYVPGKFVNAINDKAADENEHKNIWLRRADGRLIVFTPVAGLVARRIVNPVDTGDVLEAGEKVGLIRFGSKVETLMPADTELLVNVGDKVSGGLTILGRLSYQNEGKE
ncbi:MAG: phosphatidylserine decarboxylase [Candidatus Sumerlaeales bacterium]|nr:phosphatidylserine decarboxylase [Candidatus Sumerlaeales bacterium]